MSTKVLSAALERLNDVVMLEVLAGSFTLVALSEMGDKTQLLAFALAAQFKKPWQVIAGIFVATVLNHILAAALGQWISARVGPDILTLLLSGTFIAFGFWTLKPDTLDNPSPKSRLGAFATTAVLFFLVEMGDKTQLATVALAAKYSSVVLVTMGTTAGMMFTDGLAVFLGERLAKRVNIGWIRVAAASLFFAFGVAILLARFF